MEVAIRSIVHDPIVGVPLLVLLLVVGSLVIRALVSGATGSFVAPSLPEFVRDISYTLLILVVYLMGKLTAILIPAVGVEAAGIDLGPLLSQGGPLLFFTTATGLAVWFGGKQIKEITDAVAGART